MKKLLLFIVSLIAGQVLAQCPFYTFCPTDTSYCDHSTNDPFLWKSAPQTWSPSLQLSDLAEGMADLSIEVQDSCGGQNIQVEYTLFLDLNGDDTTETVIQSKMQQLPGKVLYNNYLSPNYSLGDTIVFDARAGVPDSMKYRFALELVQNAGVVTAHLKWSTGISNLNYSAAQLPLGKHRIEWRIEQGGVEAFCVYSFEVKDCAPPEVNCLPPFEVGILPNGKVTIWSSDLLFSAIDNITPSPLMLGIRKLSDSASGFPMDSLGNVVSFVEFKCSDAGFTPQVHVVELWAKDKAGNSDSCLVNISVGLGWWDCNFDPTILEVITATIDNSAIENVVCKVDGAAVGFPVFALSETTNSVGFARFTGSIPCGADFTIVPSRKDNPLNGVTTYDLVLISKHILATTPFDLPHKMIAADANKSGSITTFDILELRKLILGIYDSLPNNDSWRFWDETFSFPNQFNAFQSDLPDTIALNNWSCWFTQTDFIGVKIGDVNNTAIPNANAPLPVESRAAKFLSISDQELKAGESIEIPIRSLENSQWLGFQFGLDFDPELLEIESLGSHTLPDFDANNWAQIWPGQLSLSWSADKAANVLADDELLRLRVKAKANTTLSTAFKTQPKAKLQAEAYDLEGLVYPLQFVFSENNSGAATRIFAPQPNPTSAGTNIPVQLSASENLHLECYDVSGNVLWANDLSLGKGSHLLEIPATALPQAGLYFWSIQAGNLSETGKLMKF